MRPNHQSLGLVLVICTQRPVVNQMAKFMLLLIYLSNGWYLCKHHRTDTLTHTDAWRGVLLGAIASHSWNIYDFKVRVDVEGASIDHLPKALHIILSLSAYSLLHVIFHTKLQTLSRYASLHLHTISHSPTRSLSPPLACSRSIDI